MQGCSELALQGTHVMSADVHYMPSYAVKDTAGPVGMRCTLHPPTHNGCSNSSSCCQPACITAGPAALGLHRRVCCTRCRCQDHNTSSCKPTGA